MRVEPIDLRLFRDGSDADRRSVAATFDHAARSTGFFSVTGHGVDPTLIHEMLDVTAAFFDRPVEEKMRYYLDDRTANRGYAPEGSEALAYSLGERDLPTDLFEAFNIGCELTDEQLTDPYYSSVRDRYFSANVWPAAPVGMRDTWLAYFEAIDTVVNDVMLAAAVALGMPADHFVPYLDKGPTVMRANNYQRRPGHPTPCPGRCAWACTPTTAASPCSSPTRFPGCRSATTPASGTTCCRPRARSSSTSVTCSPNGRTIDGDPRSTGWSRRHPPPADPSAADRSPGSSNRTGMR